MMADKFGSTDSPLTRHNSGMAGAAKDRETPPRIPPPAEVPSLLLRLCADEREQPDPQRFPRKLLDAKVRNALNFGTW